MTAVIKFFVLVALGTWALTWFIQWLPCHIDPILCGGPPMPFWWYAISAALVARPVLMFMRTHGKP